MSDENKVVFLAHRNDKTPAEQIEADYLTCKTCRNKTYVIRWTKGSEFAQAACACCGADAGQLGWVNE